MKKAEIVAAVEAGIAAAEGRAGRATPPTEWRPPFPMLAVEVVPTDWQLEHGYAERLPNIGIRSKPTTPGRAASPRRTRGGCSTTT